MIIDIVKLFPLGVSQDVLAIIARLVFLLRFDKTKLLVITEPTSRDIYTIIGEDVDEVVAVNGYIPIDWTGTYSIPYEEIPDSLYFLADVGSEIRKCDDTCEIYVVNILPSTIHSVRAYRRATNGVRVFVDVPLSYYIKNEAKNLGTYTVTAIVLKKPLTDIPGEDWEDELYITLTSSIGPNVVDVVAWLIDTYTDSAYDTANFATQRTLMDAYPTNFALFDRPNVLSEIGRICFESRMGVTLGTDGLFRLSYLSEYPIDVIDSFSESNVEREGLALAYSSTEDIVTKLTATYVTDYLPLSTGKLPLKVVVRNNIGRYGLKEQDIEFHTLTDKSLVEKSATFWLIRKSNTWLIVTLKVFQEVIDLELFDPVYLDFEGKYFSTSDDPIRSKIENTSFEPENGALSISLETGIRAGETLQYKFYWPAAELPDEEWPDDPSSAGGYGPGAGVAGQFEECV
jgi:hypothetical protein